MAQSIRLVHETKREEVWENELVFECKYGRIIRTPLGQFIVERRAGYAAMGEVQYRGCINDAEEDPILRAYLYASWKGQTS